MKKYLIIEADTNDGDYVTSKNEITDEQIYNIMPIVMALKQRRKGYHNWETGKKVDNNTPEKLYIKKVLLTEEQVNYFNDFVPYGEYGVHTIESIEIIEVVKETKLL